MPGIPLTTEATEEPLVYTRAPPKRQIETPPSPTAPKKRRKKQQDGLSSNPVDNGKEDPSSVPEKISKPLPKRSYAPRDKKIRCTFSGCTRYFARQCNLDSHMRSHTGERPFVCTVDPGNCDKAFMRENNLKSHIQAVHLSEKPHRCTFMVSSGTEKSRGVFGFQRKPCEPNGEENEVDNEEGETAEKEKECGARFATMQHLKRHMESHEKTYPYICKYLPCTQGFRKHSQLARHIRSDHLNMLPFACTEKDIDDPEKQCDAAYDTKGKLGNHIKSRHLSLFKNAFICTICAAMPDDKQNDKDGDTQTKASGTSGNVVGTVFQNDKEPNDIPMLEKNPDAQEGSAGKENPRSQGPDSAASPSESNPAFPIIQATHVPNFSVHEISEARLEGRRGFETASELREHIKHFHPPICPQCGHRAKRPQALQIHIDSKHRNTLEERRKFVCEFEGGCGARFTRKTALGVHVRTTHLHIKDFPCQQEDCTFAAGTKGDLKCHVRIHHSSRPRPAKKPKKPRKYIKKLSLAGMLTGVGYEDTGRNIKCPVTDCPWRFCRMQDLKVHLRSKRHKFSKDQVVELIQETNKSGGVEAEDVESDDDNDDSDESADSVESSDDFDEYMEDAWDAENTGDAEPTGGMGIAEPSAAAETKGGTESAVDTGLAADAESAVDMEPAVDSGAVMSAEVAGDAKSAEK